MSLRLHLSSLLALALAVILLLIVNVDTSYTCSRYVIQDSLDRAANTQKEELMFQSYWTSPLNTIRILKVQRQEENKRSYAFLYHQMLLSKMTGLEIVLIRIKTTRSFQTCTGLSLELKSVPQTFWID